MRVYRVFGGASRLLVVVVAALGCRGEAAVRTARPQPPVIARAPRPAAARVPTPTSAQVSPSIDELAVVDDARFWVRSRGRVLRTTDGGASFVDRTPFPRSSQDEDHRNAWAILATPRAIFVLRGAEMMAKSMSLFVSTDDGDTFVERHIPRLRGGRSAWLQLGPAGSLLVLREDGRGMNSHETSLLASRDDGRSFRFVGEVTGYGGVTFQSPRKWWSVGTCCASAPSVYRSASAGRTWSLDHQGEDQVWDPVSNLVFEDPQRAFRLVAVDGELTFERTSDGARTWTRMTTPTGLSKVLEADERACVLASPDDLPPVASRDGGATWTTLPRPPPGSYVDHAVRMPHGFLASGESSASQRGRLFRLRDEASGWDELTVLPAGEAGSPG